MAGIHHVTAIGRDPATIIAFYRDLLGLRLVKTTVNFDDPSSHHLYFGDEAGQPGTVLTFFAHEHASPGRAGPGQATETAFAVPPASMVWWASRLALHSAAFDEPTQRFGETVLPFRDREGGHLALVATPGIGDVPGYGSAGVPAEHAIRGLYGVTLWVARAAGTASVLKGPLGFDGEGRDGTRIRFSAPGVALGGVVDLHEIGEHPPGHVGIGSIHHVAFRAVDDDAQELMSLPLARDQRIRVSPQKDRCYFRSVYFREPSGVIFEIATDGPGFTVDEPLESLGASLKLPPWLEPDREAIEATLPKLEITG